MSDNIPADELFRMCRENDFGQQSEPPFGWYCELVHDESGAVIRDTFTRGAPLEGPADVRGFSWRATALYTQ